MLIEIFLFLALGVFVGSLTGLTPGIHINLIGSLLVSLSATAIYPIQPIYLVTFITSMAITHTFVDFIPSIFLGCPDTDTELSVLPGHRLLKEGKGYEAIILTCYGSLAAIFILMLITFPSIILISKIYGFIKTFIPFIIILISTMLILSEKKKFISLFVFLFCGALGLSVLNLSDNSNTMLLPLLTGLFGGSMLIISINKKIEIPKQKISKTNTKLIKPLFGALVASPICSFLPGMGSGQAAVIGSVLTKSDNKGFLVLLGATNTLVMGFSFISLYTISKTRTGAALAIQQIMGNFSTNILIFILLISLISGLLSFGITKFLAKFFSEKIDSINYSKLSFFTFLILVFREYWDYLF